MHKKTLVIGVTGNTGAGKSTVAKALEAQGVRILDADEIARELQQPNQPALREIVRVFGSEMLRENGTLNRSKLGALVFSDREALKQLDSIMLPFILKEIQQQIRISTQPVLIDAPLLLETGMQVLCDQTWLVVAPEEVRCRRIMVRDQLTEEMAMARIRSQMSQEDKKPLATHILDGSKRPEEVRAQALAYYRQALEEEAV